MLMTDIRSYSHHVILFLILCILIYRPLLRLPSFWLVMTFSGFLGLAISFTSMWFLHQTGATTYRWDQKYQLLTPPKDEERIIHIHLLSPIPKCSKLNSLGPSSFFWNWTSWIEGLMSWTMCVRSCVYFGLD